MFWNSEVLTRIDAADDLKIAPYHPDMNTTGTPTWIWEVKVDNRLFVRAYSGTRSKWYQAALSQQAGKILAIGQEFDVLFAKPSFVGEGICTPDAKRPCSLSGELNLYKEMSVLNKKVLSQIQDEAGCNHMSPAEAVEWLDTHLLIR